ncbi:MAG: type II secretion system protein [Terracidiphilus sp.]
MNRIATTPRIKPSEEGYILVAVIFMLALLIISLAVAVPRIREDIQRDREIETMNRGKQYIRAIKLYYKKFHAYPPSVDALVKTNEIRFLRKRYTDPITGKDDWKPIAFGQNKTPLAMGFFGQPLAGAALAGTGPGGVAGATSAGSNFMSGSTSSGSGFSSGSSATGGSSIFGSSPTGSPTGATGGTTAGTTAGGTSGTSGTDSSGSGISSTQTFGGGGIIGFSPGSEKQSILVYKKKNHYNEWEFLYSPLADQMMQGGNLGTIGQPMGGTTGTGTQNNNLGGFSNSPGIGAPTTPTAPTSPTTPQQ